ncbi:MAG: putative methyltransferase [Rhodospirillales bacterium]|nr:putative methyltransferase [Rhodospirillales bacterium]
MDELLTGLRAVAEPTRLRLLALCSENELTVTELTTILGQSQPRVSRHLKLLCEGGLLERFREGNWVFYRLARLGGRKLAERLASLLPTDDPVILRDRARLGEIERERARAAGAYFAQNAHQWGAIRSLHVDERDVEAALADCLGGRPVRDLLDIGTGTGRMLELFGRQVERAVGVDRSRDMLAVARVNLERAMLRNCTVRLGEMYALPFTTPSFDLVILHQVLHFAERPAEAVAEAARVLRPGGRLLIVDFAPHQLETLREQHAHRRLGFGDDEVRDWSIKAGLTPRAPTHLNGDPLTVAIWSADRRGDDGGLALLGDGATTPQKILGEAHP